MSLLLSSPFRPPHWRGLRINQFLASEGTMRLSRKRDDDLMWRAVRYVRKWYRLRTERGQADWVAKNADVAAALELINTDAFEGIEIRARTLAKQCDEEIAAAVGVPHGVVRDYIALRFDVRARLHADSYIVNHVIRLHDTPAPNVKQLFLLQGYVHGPHAVDAWIDWLAHKDERRDLTTEVGRTRAAIDLFIQVHETDFGDIDDLKFLRNADLIMKMRAQHHHDGLHGAGFSKFVSRNLSMFLKTGQKKSDFASVNSFGSDEKIDSHDSAFADDGELATERPELPIVQREGGIEMNVVHQSEVA